MATKVISIRMTPKELADIYNYLTIACGVNAKDIPVSNAITISLTHMVKWVRTAMELPTYDTEEEALEFLKETLDKVPTCFNPKTSMPAFDVPVLPSISNSLPPGEYTVTSDAMAELIIPKTRDEKARDRELSAQRKDKVVDLIERFTEKKDAQEIDELVDNITKKDLYKNEED